jgi:NADH:ubiquinone oxidoreductase subunit K
LPLGWRLLAGAPDAAGYGRVRRTRVYLIEFLLLAAFLFCVGVYGVLARRNAVLVLMSVELLLNSVNINLVALGVHRGPEQAIVGQVFALFVIAVAAAEVGIGLAIVLLIYRNRADIDLTQVDLMKG